MYRNEKTVPKSKIQSFYDQMDETDLLFIQWFNPSEDSITDTWTTFEIALSPPEHSEPEITVEFSKDEVEQAIDNTQGDQIDMILLNESKDKITDAATRVKFDLLPFPPSS